MKQKLLLSLLVLCYVFTASGCGSGQNSSSLDYAESSSDNSDAESAEGISDESSGGTAGAGEPAAEENNTDDPGNAPDSAPKINTDMLVYTCNLSIDTLNFDQSVQTFHNMLTNAGGFVQNENYSDGQTSTSYYIEDSQKNKLYTATVRVPHDKYSDFLNGADQLGDVRSKSSNVQNVGQEYTDLNTSLSIYEAKEKRYIKMLSTITDDNQAIKIEKELTELQVKIATIKTRMNQIQTDVDYFTIEIRIHEVEKYEEQKAPEKTDTFFQRLGKTVKDTWKYFLVFLETMLFFVIRVAPYMILILAIVFVIFQIQKKRNAGWKPFPKEQPEENIEDETAEDTAADDRD